MRVIDRWGTGAVAPTLCVAPPGARRSCGRLTFASGVANALRGFRATRRGIWRVDLRIGASHVRTSIGVGERAAATKAAPMLLATGDSMMVGIDSFLADELGATAQVRSDARPGTGISKPPADWTRIAVAQAADLRPRTTVVMLGAADGFAMTVPAGAQVPCCGEPWVAEYARRVRAMMTTYARGGQGRVFWLMPPLPRQAARVPVIVAVQAAIARAAEGAVDVTVVRLDLLFTAHGYSDVVVYHGHSVRVRDVDGLHFNIQGQAVAAHVVAKLIRAEG